MKLKRLILPALGFCFVSSAAFASGPADTAIWQHVIAADRRVRASHVTWSLIQTSPPDAAVNPDRDAAAAYARAKKDGGTDLAAQQAADIVRQGQRLAKQGRSVSGKIQFEYNGKAYRADALYSPPTVGAASPPSPAEGTHVIDMYDGLNYISSDRNENLDHAAAAMKPTVTPLRGELTRNPKEAWSSSFGAYPSAEPGGTVFLFGAPLTQFFSAANSSIAPGPNGTFVITRTLNDGKLPILAKVTVSARYWRPIAYEFQNPFNHSVRLRYDATDFHNYGQNLWFASKVTIRHIMEHTGQVYQKSSYSLQDAHFNQDADLSALKHGLPAGTIISDHRFPGKYAIVYAMSPGLWSDAQVQTRRDGVLAADSQLQQAANKHRLGVLLCCFAAALVVVFIAGFQLRRRHA